MGSQGQNLKVGHKLKRLSRPEFSSFRDSPCCILQRIYVKGWGGVQEVVFNKHTRATICGCTTYPVHYSTPLPCNHPQMILMQVVHRSESEISKVINSSNTIILSPAFQTVALQHLEGLSSHYRLKQPILSSVS